MTNREASEIFDHNWTRLVNPDYTDEELGKAQNMATKVLEDLVCCGECKHLSDGRFCTIHSCHPTESDYCSWGEKE